MRLKQQFCISLCILTFFCCNQQPTTPCDEKLSQLIRLDPVNTTIKIPKDCKLRDTIIFKPSRALLNYKYFNTDSSFRIFVFVDDYSDYSDKDLDIHETVLQQKNEIENMTKSPTLTKESFKNVKSHKIAYLRYLVQQPNGTVYATRIFFYKEKRFVNFWLFEKHTEISDKSAPIADCILESLDVY